MKGVQSARKVVAKSNVNFGQFYANDIFSKAPFSTFLIGTTLSEAF